MQKFRLIAVLSIALAPMTAVADEADGEVLYGCDDGNNLRVRFDSKEAVVVLPQGEAVTLPQRPSGSGFWYSNGRHEMRGKGDEMQFAVGRRVPVSCHRKS
ncbi:MliC family protein [Peteryoungia ipomoeae]|uniref:C-type lysozyme inhibitor domain-containing protein n=1 Tax=Peteryoungia ipomoeae TaxID=1210932 RepID=A0A4S8P7M9_9HYPH|nr:MliC family protein [Peteryoungia ipomoeae]THV25505.1 hypothetical protein FAA97_04760 [Peteryoungia ipomoeae]